MSRLSGTLAARLRDLVSELSAYVSRLRDRPSSSSLPEFVRYMEATWQHLDEQGAKRAAVRASRVSERE